MLRRNSLCIGMGILLACQTQAATMYGTLSGSTQPVWNTAEPAQVGSGITPSYWDVVMPLTTSEWYPGSLWEDSLADTVTFKDKESGEAFDASIQWLGVQYNMGSASGKFTKYEYAGAHDIGNGIVANCGTGGVSNPISTLSQAGGQCVSNTGFLENALEQVTPFQFIRPIVSLPDLNTKIQGKSSGRYTAVAQYQPVYFYKSGSGALTYTVTSKPLIITIDYTAAYFVDARISKGEDGVITPIYDKANNRVTGQHAYTIDVQGLFPDGVKMTFDRGNTYEMRNAASADPLPYNIDCPLCKGRRSIVKDGALVDPGTDGNEAVTTLTTDKEGVIRFDLVTSYDVDGDTLESGTYEGNFNVIFEANL